MTNPKIVLVFLAEPEAPLIVQINPGLNEMKIQWKESFTDPDAPVLEYLVQLREKNEQSMEWRSCTEMREPLTCLMTGLRSGTMYTIRVRARNVVGYSAFTIKEAETKALDEVNPTVGVTTTTEAKDEGIEKQNSLKTFKFKRICPVSFFLLWRHGGVVVNAPTFRFQGSLVRGLAQSVIVLFP